MSVEGFWLSRLNLSLSGITIVLGNETMSFPIIECILHSPIEAEWYLPNDMEFGLHELFPSFKAGVEIKRLIEGDGAITTGVFHAVRAGHHVLLVALELDCPELCDIIQCSYLVENVCLVGFDLLFRGLLAPRGVEVGEVLEYREVCSVELEVDLLESDHSTEDEVLRLDVILFP
jgi:hypothetical protein